MNMEQKTKDYNKELEKEIGKYLDANDIEFGNQIKLFDIAKYFFELGLKHRKENNMAMEQKAKAYNKALKRAKEWLNSEELDLYTCITESIFPNPKKSEDERIRNEIIEMVRNWASVHYITKEQFSERMAWLEKQVEPVEINPTEFDTRLQALIGKFGGLPKEELIGSLRFWINAIENDETYNDEEKQNKQEEPQVYVAKDGEAITYSENDGYKVVEPKFNEGDWTVSKLDKKTRQISEVHFDEYNCYYVVNGKSVNLEEYDRLHHLWTIADIKDGDILISEDGYPFIYAGHHIYTKYLTAYCGITNDGKFKISDKTELWTNDNVEPATEEECNLLFKKMKEAGYTFDFEKKELKKIEQKIAWWSEEDEMKFADILALLRGGENCHYNTPDLFTWFKSIKDRIFFQPKQEWNEEDEKMIWAIPLVIKNYPNQEMFYGYRKEKLISWIKSLKERYVWKPNDEQIEALEHFVRSIGESEFASPYDSNTELVYSLLSELKKL